MEIANTCSERGKKMIVYCGLRHFYIHHFEPPQQDAYYILTQNGEIWDFSPALKKYGVTSKLSPRTVFWLDRPVFTQCLELAEYEQFSGKWHDFCRLYTQDLEPEYPHAWYLRFRQKTILEQFLFDFDQEAQRKGSGAILGAGASKLVAKLAAHNAPPGQNVIEPEKTEKFLARIPLSRLPLPETDSLEKLGLRTIGELAALPPVELTNQFGSRADFLRRLGRGEDTRPFRSRDVTELSWSLDCTVLDGFLRPLTPRELLPYLKQGLQELAASLRGQNRAAGLLKLEIGTEQGELLRTERRFKEAADQWQVFKRAVQSLLPAKPIAHLTVRLAGLQETSPTQLGMFVERAAPKTVPLPPRLPAQIGVELPRRERFLLIWKEQFKNEQAN